MVGEGALNDFSPFNKKRILVGQEAVIDVDAYRSKGVDPLLELVVEACTPSHSKSLLDELRSISEEWLDKTNRKEVSFYTSTFDADVVKHQQLLLLRCGKEKKPVAFVTVMPMPVSDSCSIGLFRMGDAVPAGSEEVLMDGLVEYARQTGYRRIHLGIASSIGVIEPETMPERIQHYVSNRFKPLKDFQSQREFLEKYATGWINRYLLYGSDYDLFLIPVALRRVTRPSLI